MKKIKYTSFFLLFILVILGFYLYSRQFRDVLPAILPVAQPPENRKQNKEIEYNATGIPLFLMYNFSIEYFAQNLNGAPRDMILDNNNTLITSLTKQGKVIALPNADNDNKADKIVTLIQNLNHPHGLALRCEQECHLYIAESDELARYVYDPSTLTLIQKEVLISLPDGGRHFTRSLLFRPPPYEKELLISVGSSCDTCNESDWRNAKILMLNIETNELTEFASGLRNAVFMAINPKTSQIWATEMGRDFLGDDLPPDEINIIEQGKNYGWPSCYGNKEHDSQFDSKHKYVNFCRETAAPQIELPAHSAPLGLDFFPESWGEAFNHNLLVAYHGSWNRTVPTGYKIVEFDLSPEGGLVATRDFISGWFNPDEDSAYGRPVDILITNNKRIFISDDKAEVIYAVQYHGNTASLQETTTTVYKNLIILEKPLKNQLITNPLILEGKARGTWFFEATFPIKLVDQRGRLIIESYAAASDNWMTKEYVPFYGQFELTIPKESETGTLYLIKNNSSGLPENDDQVEIPVRFQ